jgi:hypothetical protein
MKPPRKHLAILRQSEIQDLFGPPRLTIEEKRFYFTLNDLELKSFQSIRDRQQRCYFVLLLGYFKVKPVMLNIGFSDVRDDLDFVRAEYLPGSSTKKQNLTKSQRRAFTNGSLNMLAIEPIHAIANQASSAYCEDGRCQY